MVRVRKPPVRRPSPCWFYGDCEAPHGCIQDASEEGMKPSCWTKREVLCQKIGSRLPVKTLERPFFEAYVVTLFHNVVNLFHYVVRLNQISNS